MLIHDLTSKYGPVIREGKVTGVLESAFDVVIVSYLVFRVEYWSDTTA
jgi:protein SSD1